jgi:hypothetical protein
MIAFPRRTMGIEERAEIPACREGETTMNNMTLTISNDANPQSRIVVARRLPSKSAENQAQSAVFSPKLSLIAAIYTTYKAIFADQKFSQTAQIKSVSRKHLHPILKSLGFCR